MIKFFRNIRKKLADENKFLAYSRYAIGEIILVVIGILIALQVNNWNNNRLNKVKEKYFLSEIITNLKTDSLKLQGVLEFNQSKLEVTQNIMEIFIDTLSNKERLDIFFDNADAFPRYELFRPKETAFKNLITSENLNLITNKNIRNLLIDYYEFDYEKYQESIWIRTRIVVDNYFNYFTIKEKTPFSNSFPSLQNLKVHEDQKFYSDLFGLLKTIDYQTNFIKGTQFKNEEILSEINNFLH